MITSGAEIAPYTMLTREASKSSSVPKDKTSALVRQRFTSSDAQTQWTFREQNWAIFGLTGSELLLA
jgi:hypothetical protein